RPNAAPPCFSAFRPAQQASNQVSNRAPGPTRKPARTRAISPDTASPDTVSPDTTPPNTISKSPSRHGPSRLSSHSLRRSFHLLHHPQRVATQDLLNIRCRITLCQQRVRDLRQMRCVFHSVGHVRAVEIRSQSHMIRARQFHGVINMLDDLSPFHPRQLALGYILSCNLIAFGKLAAFIFC